MSQLLTLTHSLIVNHRTAWELAKREMATRFAGASLGVVWSFINPLIFVIVYWAVFTFIFDTKTAQGKPFVLSLLCGYAPWALFAESLAMGTNSVVASAHMVTKTVFPSEILPLAHILVGMLSHLFFLVLLVILMLLHGYTPGWMSFQFVYYLAGLSVLTLGLSWIFAAANVFLRDIAYAVSALLQVVFWLTPIVWDLGIVPEKLRPFVKLNPLAYVVEGFKGSFLYGQPFWHDWVWGCYFWVVAAVVLSIGAYVFGRLKGEFADVL